MQNYNRLTFCQKISEDKKIAKKADATEEVTQKG